MLKTLLIGVAIAMPTFLLGAIMGAPYLPTLKRQRQTALNLLALKPGQTVVDLGCGDGGFLVEAAQQGIRGIGYELNPLLWLVAKQRTWAYRSNITIHFKNYWKVQLPPAEGIYVFLVQHYMKKLNHKLTSELSRPTKLVSYSFTIPGKKAVKESKGLYLYKYP